MHRVNMLTFVDNRKRKLCVFLLFWYFLLVREYLNRSVSQFGNIIFENILLKIYIENDGSASQKNRKKAQFKI